MGTAFLWIVVGSSLWMAFDAHQIGYDKKDARGIAGMGPVGWLFGGLLLWIVAFPLYLASRSKLKAAAAQKTGHGTPTEESVVGADATHESEQKSLPSRIGRGFVNTVYGLGALVVATSLLIGIMSDSDDKFISGQPASASEAIASSAAAGGTTSAANNSEKPKCARRSFPSCDAARNVYFQWRNQLGLHSFDERCRHANAARFLDDSCGGPGSFQIR